MIRADGCEVLHCHGSRANLMGMLLRGKTDIPMISTVHSDYKLDYMGRPFARLTFGTINAWALRHLDQFPVEVMKADYDTLLRVPGIGYKSAQRIVKARRLGSLDYGMLKKMGVVLKRAVYFITCSGRMMYPVQIHEDAIAAQLISEEKRKQWQLSQSGLYRQMSLFDDFHMAQA